MKIFSFVLSFMFLGAATAAVASNSSSQNGDEVLRSNCGQLCTSNQDCRDGKCPVCSSKDNVCRPYDAWFSRDCGNYRDEIDDSGKLKIIAKWLLLSDCSGE
ncbi:hypothetical protein C8Q69DRAFT_146819 [Paecilomyces variotii]|uniref:Uncharacterized protein n=1 Tax=Byssochlamys spectabilis TaxID=264951 RepID=A0A443I0X8_BYSSP|nr:hypothetical protein C8Q69DRAFT_146819 [Paecilomyces variotii]RWQ97706.1 hypothetical protein C8Q69DRAFT_146819 [Paecilomyces variotii]